MPGVFCYRPTPRGPTVVGERETFCGRASEREEAVTQFVPTLGVTPQQSVELEGSGEAVSGRPGETGRDLEPAEGLGFDGDGLQHPDRLVENTDTRYSVHIARTLSRYLG